MHTPSTRTLSALAYDRGEEYDPAQPIEADLLETLALAATLPGPLIRTVLADHRTRTFDQRSQRTAANDLPGGQSRSRAKVLRALRQGPSDGRAGARVGTGARQ